MITRYRIAAALCGLILAIAPVRAAEPLTPPSIVNLSDVLRLVRDQSPRLAADREGIAAAEADRITARAFPNPTVSYGRARPSGGMNGTQFTGMRQEQVGIEQPLLFPWQYAARVGRANREIEAARARVTAGASSLSAEAGSSFIELLAAQERFELLTAANTELVRFREIVAGRQMSGVASQYDLARIDVELASFDSQQAEAGAHVTETSAVLAALVGLRDWRPRASGKLSTDILPGPLPAMTPSELARSSPAVIAAERERDAAEAGVVVARRERWPNLSLSGGRTFTTHPFGATDFFGLSIEIPIFDTRLGPLAHAESDARAALYRQEAATAETIANLEGLANVVASRQAALRRFETGAAARLPGLRQMAEDNYRLRSGSILELLDATRSRIELEGTRIELVSSLIGSQLRFLAISGNLDRAFAPPGGAAPGR